VLTSCSNLNIRALINGLCIVGFLFAILKEVNVV
jgi:hypothetical protein